MPIAPPSLTFVPADTSTRARYRAASLRNQGWYYIAQGPDLSWVAEHTGTGVIGRFQMKQPAMSACAEADAGKSMRLRAVAVKRRV